MIDSSRNWDGALETEEFIISVINAMDRQRDKNMVR